MNQSPKLIGFWLGCLRRAGGQTWTHTRKNLLLQAALPGVAVALTAGGILLFLHNRDVGDLARSVSLVEGVLVSAILGLVGLLLVPTCVFAWNLAYEPLRQIQGLCAELASRGEETRDLRVRLRDLTTPRLRTSNGSVPGAVDGHWWFRLRVDNPTNAPATQCYAQLKSMRSLNSNGQPTVPRGQQEPFNLPGDGTRFPWQEWAGVATYERSIGPTDHDFIDIAFMHDRSCPAVFVRVVAAGEDPSSRYHHPISGPLLYEGVVLVGSRDTAGQPCYARFVIDVDKRHLEVEEVLADSGYVDRR